MSDTERIEQAEPDSESGQSETAVLEVSDLKKIYSDGTLAVDEISFTVDRGDFCVIIGPSGCGKSTTLHSLVGKVEPTDGTVTLDGEDITDKPTYERDIGLVFQDFQLFPHLNVEENIRYGLDRIGLDSTEAETRVKSMIEMMRLGDIRDRPTGELSAGQKQRVALARSLALEPSLLLLDEPLGDMDYKLQKRMERELLRIHRQLDTTIIYVTHDQTQAMRLADQIVVMNDGKIEQSGSVSDVYDSPATAFTATFVGDSNIFFGEVTESVAGGSQVSVSTPYGTFRASTSNLRSDTDAVIGREIPFAVRPQYMRLTEETTNTLECEVLDVLYRPGEGTQLLLEADAGKERMELQFKSWERIEAGGTVTLGWDPEDTILLSKLSVIPDINLEKDILGE